MGASETRSIKNPLWSNPYKLLTILKGENPFLVEESIWFNLFREEVLNNVTIRFGSGEQVSLTALMNYLKENLDTYKYKSYILCIPKKWSDQYSTNCFNLHHYKKIDPADITQSMFYPLIEIGKAIVTEFGLYQSLVDALRALLEPHYAWNFILEGHGSAGLEVCIAAGMHFNEFKNFLQFLNNEIKTNILVYSTCRSTSAAQLKIYTTNDKPDTFNFPIMLTGISGAIINSYTYKNPELYKNFFQLLRKISLCPKNLGRLGKTASLMFEVIYQATETEVEWLTLNNIIQIRWSGETQFNPIPIDNVITRAQIITTKPKVFNYIVVNENVLIIDTPFINEKLIFTKLDYKGHKIISDTQEKWHYINTIEMPKKEGDAIQDSMKRLLDYFNVLDIETTRMFLINEVIVPIGTISEHIHDVIVFVHALIPQHRWQKKFSIVYRHGGKAYYQDLDGNVMELTSEIADRYFELFMKEKEILSKKHAPLKTIPSEKGKKGLQLIF